MYVITITPKNSWKGGFTIDGHAMYEEYGRDIVCAGVSAIGQYVAHALKEEGHASVNKSSGHLDVTIYTSDHTVDVLIGTFVRTMGDIQRQYPKNVRIESEHSVKI